MFLPILACLGYFYIGYHGRWFHHLHLMRGGAGARTGQVEMTTVYGFNQFGHIRHVRPTSSGLHGWHDWTPRCWHFAALLHHAGEAREDGISLRYVTFTRLTPNDVDAGGMEVWNGIYAFAQPGQPCSFCTLIRMHNTEHQGTQPVHVD